MLVCGRKIYKTFAKHTLYTFIKIEQIELLIFIQNILKTFVFIEMEISPLILHVQADGAKKYFKYACDTLHFIKVTFHRAGEIRNNVRSYLKFLFREALRSLFSIRYRRSFRSSRKYREKNAGKRSLEIPSKLFRTEKIDLLSVEESVIKKWSLSSEHSARIKLRA